MLAREMIFVLGIKLPQELNAIRMLCQPHGDVMVCDEAVKKAQGIESTLRRTTKKSNCTISDSLGTVSRNQKGYTTQLRLRLTFDYQAY